ncbi:SHOCT domain-containing protein [Pseudarthrobacter sp. S9]|uniref:SHOCT domain-containing protein n=1 Tax=Pseudarthrobacter sp. S9 TaxID=3418421 RepID=UPI003D05A9C6
METPEKLRGPLSPFILGILIAVAGIICGLSVPVGAYCESAFSQTQHSAKKVDLDRAYSNAMKVDLHQAYSILPETDYESVCKASAAQWSVLWWAVIALGVVVFCLGFVLWNRARRIAVIPATAHDVPAARVQGVAAELAHLAQLRDQGMLTQSQFEQQKAKLLDG